jgi:hypothetical protein
VLPERALLPLLKGKSESNHNRPMLHKKGWEVRKQGKGKGKYKRHWIRCIGEEPEEYEEEGEESRDEHDDMGKTLALMNEDRKKEFYMALKQDFQ